MHSDYEYGSSGHQHDSGLYYDSTTNLYWHPSTQKWYSYNEGTYHEAGSVVDASAFIPQSTDEKPSGIPMEELAKIYRQVAEALQPGEKISRASKRLNEKASSENKDLLNQLMDDAIKLVDNGDTDVYVSKQEYFVEKADYYEKLVMDRKPTEIPAAEIPAAEIPAASRYEYYDEGYGPYGRSYTSEGDVFDHSADLYWFASTQKWYFHNEETNTYDGFWRVEPLTLNSPMRLELQWGRYGFTAHGGFFEDQIFGGPSDLNVHFDSETFKVKAGTRLITDLHKFWPSVVDKEGRPKEPNKVDNITFWEYQWNKHGRFSGLTQVAYFRMIVDLVKSFRRDVKIVPGTIEVKDLIAYIHSQIGATVMIRASQEYDQTSSSHICFVEDVSLDYDVHLNLQHAKRKFRGDISCENTVVTFR